MTTAEHGSDAASETGPGAGSASGPHDAPNVSELIEAVREWIDRDVMAGTDGRLRFHARVASNILAIVERELELGAAQAEAHRVRLDELGVADDVELAARIRARELDAEPTRLRELLRAAVEDKLRVANPKYLD